MKQSLDEKAKEYCMSKGAMYVIFHGDMTKPEDCNYTKYDFTEYYKAGFIQGRQDALRECVEICNRLKKNYPYSGFEQLNKDYEYEINQLIQKELVSK